MIKGTEGASKTPKALALVTKLMPRCSGYPALRSKGSNKPPKAKMVTPLPPVKAVKNEHNTVAANKVPIKPLPKMAKNKTPKR